MSPFKFAVHMEKAQHPKPYFPGEILPSHGRQIHLGSFPSPILALDGRKEREEGGREEKPFKLAVSPALLYTDGIFH